MYQSETLQWHSSLTLVSIFSCKSMNLGTARTNLVDRDFVRDWQMRSANYTVDCNDRIAAGYPHYVLAT